MAANALNATSNSIGMAPSVLDPPRTPHILLIDAFDSFTNNLASLLCETTGASMCIVKITTEPSELLCLLKQADAVVVSPGPGTPVNPEDVGIIDMLWTLSDELLLPVLGVCLGFQSLALAFGGKIERLKEPKHGIVSEIIHSDMSIFSEVEDINATRYHSLHANIGHDIQVLKAVKQPKDLWESTSQAPELEPLAWTFDADNGAVLMATKHASKPFWGLQYHPESICTGSDSTKVIRNWWKEVGEWNSKRHRAPVCACTSAAGGGTPAGKYQGKTPLATSLNPQEASVQPSAEVLIEPLPKAEPCQDRAGRTVISREAHLPEVGVTEICNMLRYKNEDFIILESAGKVHDLSRYHIIGLIYPGETTRLDYIQRKHVIVETIDDTRRRGNLSHDLRKLNCSPWSFLKLYLEQRRATGGLEWSPFWGGFMGYSTYETGLATLGVATEDRSDDSKDYPDMSFSFIERSVVIDRHLGTFCVQSVIAGDEHWVNIAANNIIRLGINDCKIPPETRCFHPTPELEECVQRSIVVKPKEQLYKEKIRKCQEYIRAGDSYELCLTAQTKVRLPVTYARQDGRFVRSDFAWQLYQSLQYQNPAPFSAFMQIGKTTIISSSPERFLRWTRDGLCQMRPIKGTVKKHPQVTREMAEWVLGQDKERAENLMIVDLIRHDLYGIVGAGGVQVPKLMIVEEYETVYQLVSVIEAHLTTPNPWVPPPEKPSDYEEEGSRAGLTGIDVLATALPPGSMTGAPKYRSCQLLDHIEDHQPRGVYSGVLGYMSVCGGGDFSVMIRSAIRRDEELDLVTTCGERADGFAERAYEVWRIGAGGAVTTLSTEQGEWDEMNTKLESTLRAFRMPGK
ncbi:MAG: para-aminobenzoate synthase, (PABA) [Geoglossum umbratile]|nr:MAG: para-aminobenzoate synthase, (PABA) [Geoglossum umbratile]